MFPTIQKNEMDNSTYARCKNKNRCFTSDSESDQAICWNHRELSTSRETVIDPDKRMTLFQLELCRDKKISRALILTSNKNQLIIPVPSSFPNDTIRPKFGFPKNVSWTIIIHTALDSIASNDRRNNPIRLKPFTSTQREKVVRWKDDINRANMTMENIRIQNIDNEVDHHEITGS
jgi:hypothetical protein